MARPCADRQSAAMYRHESGVTALDLLVTMAIMVILLVTAVPGFQAWSLNHAMSAALGGLQADLQYARAEAIRLRQAIVACPGQPPAGCNDGWAWHDGWLIFADANGDRQWQESEPLLRQAPTITALAIVSSQARNRLRFSPQGAAPGSNASLTFCDLRGAAHARQIRLSANGRIRRLDAEELADPAC